MIRQVLSHMDLGALSFSVLALFLVFFVLVFVWVFRKNARSHYDRLAQLPLQKEE